MATLLKMLLAQQHLERHSDFLVVYDRCAAQLDPPLRAGYGPGKTQFYHWLSGRMIGLPRGYHCRVLAKMFPGWRIDNLFQRADTTPVTAQAHKPGFAAVNVELEAFLGAEMITSGVTLVYPALDLPIRPMPALPSPGVPNRYAIGAKGHTLAGDHGSDVLVTVSEKEFHGLLYVLSVLQRHTGISAEIRSDREVVAHSDCPYISFGLKHNDCTRMYLDSIERPLFIFNGGVAENMFDFSRLELIDGTRYEQSGDRYSFGVIARVRPSPGLHSDRYWIFCAGLGPRGTTGASWYLANSWDSLHRRAGDREFVAVVATRNDSDATAHLEHLQIGSGA